MVPTNITLVRLPPYTPELNPAENVWQYLRAKKLAHRLFDDYRAIVDACSKLGTTSSNAPPSSPP